MGGKMAGGTWEDENWARPIPLVDESTGMNIDIESLLERGIVLIANPARFCPDLAMTNDDEDDGDGRDNKRKKDKFLGGLFDDPFPAFAGASSSRSSSSRNGNAGGILVPIVVRTYCRWYC